MLPFPIGIVWWTSKPVLRYFCLYKQKIEDMFLSLHLRLISWSVVPGGDSGAFPLRTGKRKVNKIALSLKLAKCTEQV